MMVVYPTRYAARKAQFGDEVCVRVCGGYALMSCSDYRIWRKQK